MGLLDQVLGNAIPRAGAPQQKPGLGSTIAAGVVLALLVKGVREYQKNHPDASPDRSIETQNAPSGTVNKPSGLGGILSGLVGAGGLGGLLSQFGGAGANNVAVDDEAEQPALPPRTVKMKWVQ